MLMNGIYSNVCMYVYGCMQLRSNTLRWCKANFGEIFSAWIHLKVRRLQLLVCMYVCGYIGWMVISSCMYVCSYFLPQFGCVFI